MDVATGNAHAGRRTAAAERRVALGKVELDARSAYHAALAAASASLRHAQQIFEAASAAIDAHIARSVAADAASAFSAAPSRQIA